MKLSNDAEKCMTLMQRFQTVKNVIRLTRTSLKGQMQSTCTYGVQKLSLLQLQGFGNHIYRPHIVHSFHNFCFVGFKDHEFLIYCELVVIYSSD